MTLVVGFPVTLAPARRLRSYRGSFSASCTISAVVRARDEAGVIAGSVQSVAGHVDEIVVVDNCSSDGTVQELEAVRDEVERRGTALRVHEYPHEIARVGTENWRMPQSDPRSLASFYNYSFALAAGDWLFKWDADMLLTTRGAMVLDLVRKGASSWDVHPMSRLPVYVDLDRNAWLDREGISTERFLYRNTCVARYRKGILFEILFSADLSQAPPCDDSIVELKMAAKDEFLNTWTSPVDVQLLGNDHKRRSAAILSAMSSRQPVEGFELVRIGKWAEREQRLVR